MRRIGFLVLVMACALCAPTLARAQSEQDTLSVLADQAFQLLNDIYVQLPNGTTERLARSGNVGLVAGQYVQQGFSSLTLSELDAGWWLTFRNVNEGFDVVVKFQRDAHHQIRILVVTAGAVDGGIWDTSPQGGSGDPCASTGDNKKCAGTGGLNQDNHYPNGASCDNGSKTFAQTSQNDGYGHPIYENVDNQGETMVGCSASADGNTVVLSPR